MHGRRGAGVERRKRGHSWYQSSVCIISFSSYPFHCCMQVWKGKPLLFLILISSSYCSGISQPLSHSCDVWKAGRLPPSCFFAPRLAQQVCVRTPPPESSRWHMVAQAQMSGCVPGPLDNRQLPPLSPLASPLLLEVGTNTPPPEPFVVPVRR